MKRISASDLKPRLTNGEEIAFLDVREQGQYGEGHPFFCIPFAFSRLEALADSLLPCRATPLVLLDDADGVAERAAAVFEGLGYKDVSVLDGGAPAWEAAGYTLYKGVNVVSKTYGELLEHAADTPRLTADELNALRASNPNVVVLDGRSPAEYRKMSLPGATCCPNAELGYRIRSLAPDPDTTVIINCAGRTRSILGVEGLRVLNIPNPIFALENGTQGWKLAGFELEHGVEPQKLPAPDAAQLDEMSTAARQLIAASGLETVSPETVADWLSDERRTTYLLDVRSAEEFSASHWPGARHAPGGQLVQATDQYVAVRYARIVLIDDNRLRATTTAIRLRDMGHRVWLLDADARDGAESAAGQKSATSSAGFPSADELEGRSLLDASRGMDYRDGHIDGARWVTRARLDRLGLETQTPVLVTGRSAELAETVGRDLRGMGITDLRVQAGDPATWRAAGHRVVSTPDEPSETDCIDYLFFVHDRHDGNMDAARRYLEWEVGLVDQLDEQERGALNPRASFNEGGSA